ncbi:Activating signal cointegrator 1 complex subunit 2 [Blomia tropicalis]|nr:Activating signal cointegrator 1 complex subunit 2 [Blomia tropicalis]
MENNLSARPKVRSIVQKEPHKVYKPIEKKFITFVDQDGDKKSISLISKEFNLKINRILYYEPSFEEFNNLSQMTLHNWIINCRKYESMLLGLVNLPYFRFWSAMSFNCDLIVSLESYLCNASRPYRLHPMVKKKEIKSVLSNIHKLFFKVFVRILISKESQENFMEPDYHLTIVNNIVDVPKIINLIQLYGYGSDSEILRHLLKNIIEPHKEFKQNLKIVCDEIVSLLNFQQFSLEPDNNALSQLYNLVVNITDIFFSLNKLFLFEPRISTVLMSCNFTEALLNFYGNYFPFVEDQCENLFKKNVIVENLYKFLQNQIILSQSCALLLFHRILQKEFVSPVNDANCKDNQAFDSLISILNCVVNQKRFCYDFFTKFSFEKEFDPLLQNNELNNQLSLGDVLAYYKLSLKTSIEEHLSHGTRKQIPNDSNVKENNLINLNYEPKPNNSSDQMSSNIRDDPQIVMKEQSIREMFPDFGDGFIYKCLEHYDFDNEKVIDAILECNLPPHLESLDHNLKKNDLIRICSSDNLQRSNLTFNMTKDKYDPTSNKDRELAQIYIGKKDKISCEEIDRKAIKEKTIGLSERINEEEEDAKENVKNLMERGKLTIDQLQSNIEYVGLYEDEFDDTYQTEDPSLDTFEETFSDGDENEDNEEPSIAQSNQSTPSMFKTFNSNDKFDNQARFSKNQYYNKRNYYRKQTNESSNQSAPRQSGNKPTNVSNDRESKNETKFQMKSDDNRTTKSQRPQNDREFKGENKPQTNSDDKRTTKSQRPQQFYRGHSNNFRGSNQKGRGSQQR